MVSALPTKRQAFLLGCCTDSGFKSTNNRRQIIPLRAEIILVVQRWRFLTGLIKNQNPVYVVRHHNKGIKHHKWEANWDLQPALDRKSVV